MQIKRVIRITVDLDRQAVENFDLDAAAGVAVEADGIQGVFRFQQLVGLGLGQLAGSTRAMRSRAKSKWE